MVAPTELPEGFCTVTPTLIVSRASEAIDLYKKAFGATEEYRMEAEDGKIVHACIKIGNSKMFLLDSAPDRPGGVGTKCSFYMYVKDVDASFSQATSAGMQQIDGIEEMFWGDRSGCVKDPFGNYWTLATHVRDVSPEEMKQGEKEFLDKREK
ncbi:MAG: VOC family protein [Alphaproteobacteria bacterium]|nr:VOC family protein [Alphaproteobacteria bacterium]